MALADLISMRDQLDAAIEREQGQVAASGLGHDTRIETDGLPPTSEEPMYSWIGPKPYKNHKTFRIWFRRVDGARAYETFATETEALSFIAQAQGRLVKDGRPIGEVVDAYLASLTKLRPSSIATLRYRLRAITKGRERMPIEAFPWATAWRDHVALQSGDSQHGICAALHGLVRFANLRGEPLKRLQVSKARNEGKPQLRVSEARAFITLAMDEGDPLAIAAATMAVTGLRPGEVMALKARDCDDNGALIWVERGKTRKASRTIEVEPAFRSVLSAAAKGKSAGDLLFEFTPERKRHHQNIAKARTDALLRRVRSLCKAAGVPEVVSHSLRGLNATLRTLGGASKQSVADALGHESFKTTSRYYLDRGAAEQADSRRSHGRLLESGTSR